MLWGRAADSSLVGRKAVILIGLSGTLISSLGFGFSTTFYQALLFRSLGGITNGNTGVLRTMISETIREKKYQSRAFLLLPMTFNIGVIIGPILGGLLSDPAGSYPSTFGDVEFFKRFPYATPNIVSAMFLGMALLLCWLMLEEVCVTYLPRFRMMVADASDSQLSRRQSRCRDHLGTQIEEMVPTKKRLYSLHSASLARHEL
ncbi:hypothetical protein NUW58_g10876 [Xylaria curta]|uniref:Uncharacterized protein n=1 Tax=Xylaria curta TaxID=42375 RepID=A0ACC1MGV2_9PEZI|nr:hypothetical protein NUW58_g10876 [Xylaria curta]